MCIVLVRVRVMRACSMQLAALKQQYVTVPLKNSTFKFVLLLGCSVTGGLGSLPQPFDPPVAC